jgi:deoxyribonuclease-4
MPFLKNIHDTIKVSISSGMSCVQFFMGNPKTTTRTRISQNDIEKSLKLTEKFPMNVFSHFPYISNLAGSVKSLAWNGDDAQDEKTTKVLSELEYELGILSNFGTSGSGSRSGTVIHPGNYSDRKLGLKTIAQSINKINFPKNSKLILENAAGAGNVLCTTFQEIRDIYDQVSKEKQTHIGVCIDTEHTFACGIYDLRKITEVDRMFEEFDEILGLDKFTLLHLNDSVVSFGSKKDRHELLLCGQIWKEDCSSLFYLLNMCKKHNIPIILETTPMDMFTLAQLGDTDKISINDLSDHDCELENS